MGLIAEAENVRPKGLGVRHAQTILLFFAMLLAYQMRVNMSMAIVDMTDDKKDTYFDWSHSVQSVILSSFFWGYIILQIPAGELARRFGGKMLIMISIGVNSAISLLIPFGAPLGGWILVCICRVLQGLSQAFMFPCMHHLISQWIPLEEKGLLATTIYAGAQLGIALQMIVSGFLATAWGWEAIFYTNGTLGAIWTLCYSILGADSPERSKIISPEELQYIQTSLGRVGESKRYPTPWRAIITSLPFWAVIVAHCGQNWGFFTLMTEMPTYMANVLKVDLKSNGMLSSLPYFAMYLLSFPMGAMTDIIIRKKWLSVTHSRKLFNSIGLWGPALALIFLSYAPEGNMVFAVVMLTISVGINAGTYLGYILVHIDMAPNFSASLMGITNFLANIISIIAPLVCGFIIQDETKPSEWRKVFFVASGVYFFTNLFFVLFSTSEKQPWNEPTQTDIAGLGVRHVQTMLLTLATLLAFQLRVNMSLAIVDMTDTRKDKYFDWTLSMQSVILSSFFWGYIILQIPGGELARRFGGKILLLIAIGANSAISLLIPFGASLGGWILVCIFRFLQGLALAFLYPCLYHLISQWIPLEEKGILGSIILSGGQLGTGLQLIVSGFLATAWGWPAIFYTNGTLGAIWTLSYSILGADSPERSKTISPEELQYIQTSLGRVGEIKRYPTPWRAIMTSLPFWALAVTHCGQNWSYFTLMTEMPTYMAKVLNVDMKSNGILSSLPYFSMYLVSFPMGVMTDVIIRKKWLSVTHCRKLFNSIGLWVPAITLIFLSYAPEGNKVFAVVMLIISVGINAGAFVGFLLVPIDMAPNFSASLMGITNFMANCASVIAPLVAGFIIQDETQPSEWRKVFFLASGVYFFTNLFFVLFGTSEKQPWNEPMD